MAFELSKGAPPAEDLPLPVTIIGGEVAILGGAEVPAIWGGPYGYNPNNQRQVTTTDPGASWVDGDGAVASDEARAAGGWNADRKARFLAEFPTARPGLLYGVVISSWGGSVYTYICDMYGPDTTSTKEYRDRQDWAYNSKYFNMKRLFEPKFGTGMWQINFVRAIPFHLGLRISYDNGSSSVWFLYSLDPAFAP